MIFRTEAQKKDQALSWKRGDRSFFASGACHILTHVFLQDPGAGKYRPYVIQPRDGLRGSHIYAATDDTVFDYNGFSQKERFLEHYFCKIKRFFPGWDATIIELSDFMTPAFFSKFNYRAPHQYFADPLPRAKTFIQRKCIHRHFGTREEACGGFLISSQQKNG